MDLSDHLQTSSGVCDSIDLSGTTLDGFVSLGHNRDHLIFEGRSYLGLLLSWDNGTMADDLGLEWHLTNLTAP